MHKSPNRIVLLTLGAALALAAPAGAWGLRGHATINRTAALALPASLPAFVRSPDAVREIAALGPELDELKGAGRAWDADYDPGHYLDLRDDGTIAGTLRLRALPPTREAYDTALRAAGSDQYKAGYLPYSIVEGWEQLRMDFANWRAASGAQRALEQQLVLRDIGVWGHYVGDASQPLHVTVHFNGWGRYPNPAGYTQAPIHEMFESTFVDRYAEPAAVMRLLSPPRVPAGAPTQARVMSAVESYLRATNATVPELYRIEKAGGFAHGSPAAVAFVDARLAAGASELRDLVVWAWQSSAHVRRER